MMKIRVDDLQGPEIRALLEEHLAQMHAESPPESVHALDLARLRHPSISFWTIWDGAEPGLLLGCGALKLLDAQHGELKSMRTPAALRGRGAGRAMLLHIIEQARARGLCRLSLETGSQPAFDPARRLYASAGFRETDPFGDYVEDPNSVFMTLELEA
jgi:putative acetyltransferase